MEQFLRQLQTIPEAAELIRRVEEGGCPAAVSGLQPVQRACVGAAVAAACGRPAVFLCGDEREVQVLSADLETLTGKRPVTLLGREWQFRPGAVGSRDWERSRLAALYALAQGDAPVVVATADGLMARTLPPETLRSLAITLEVGGQAELGALAEQLLSAGYTRCEQVEGVGQFALRGGILDVFSPLMDQPVRCEFFDDEIDSMGAFDPGTQRRTRNVSSARILPAAEVLPHCAPGGLPGLADQLIALAEKLAKKQKTEAIVQTLREDAERLHSGAALGAADRYLAAIYPAVTAGVHYLPPDAVVFLSESGRVDERVKNTVLQQKQDVEALLSAGVLAGDYAHLTLTAEELYAALEDFPVILEDSLPTSRHPLRPRGLLTMNAKQLSSYGGSLETAVTDLEHYRSSGSAVLVLCGGETRAKNLHRLLEEKGEALFAAWHRRLTEFDQGIQGLRHLRVLGHGREAGAHYPGIFALDPAKILISTQGTGLTGVALRDLLRREYRIEVEMALDHYVLAMTGLGTDDAMPARLAQALLAIDETCASSEETPSVLAVPGALPPRRCSLEEAAQAPGGLSFLYDAMGKVCGEYIWAYPPGIPLIAPGEEITPPLVETVEGLYRAGVRLIGTRGKPPFTTFALGDQDG